MKRQVSLCGSHLVQSCLFRVSCGPCAVERVAWHIFRNQQGALMPCAALKRPAWLALQLNARCHRQACGTSGGGPTSAGAATLCDLDDALLSKVQPYTRLRCEHAPSHLQGRPPWLQLKRTAHGNRKTGACIVLLIFFRKGRFSSCQNTHMWCHSRP
jgi:hypothetical protein